MKKENILWGVLLIIVGVLFLGKNLEWWNINIFFDGWWTLLIIFFSIRGLFDKNSRTWSFITLVLGILMLLACQEVIAWNMIWKILIPILIIIIGLSLMFDNKKGKKINRKNAKQYVAVFSGIDEKIQEIESDFNAVAVFGGIELDLREAKLKKDIVIEAVTVFGGIDIKAPKNIKLVINGLPIFGGVENKYEDNTESDITIHLNYTCIFGGIDIL